MANKFKDFLKLHESKIVLFIGFVLVSAISFEFGLIQGKKDQEKPIIIEKSVLAQNQGTEAAQGTSPQAQNSLQEAKITPKEATIPPSSCAFVGSKNSNKYHLPTCRFAKLIKPANLVCFSSTDAAVAKGYLPDKGCIK